MTRDDVMCFGGDEVTELARLAAELPPGAVLAHVVTQMPKGRMKLTDRVAHMRAWAKIGDEPWRSISSASIEVDTSLTRGHCHLRNGALTIEWVDTYHPWSNFRWETQHRIVTPSVTWEQSYGLVGRHEVMGVVG